MLQYLQSLGLVPGARVTVVAIAPFGGVVTVRVRSEAVGDDATHALGAELAERIFVTRDGATDETNRDEAPR